MSEPTLDEREQRIAKLLEGLSPERARDTAIGWIAILQSDIAEMKAESVADAEPFKVGDRVVVMDFITQFAGQHGTIKRANLAGAKGAAGVCLDGVDGIAFIGRGRLRRERADEGPVPTCAVCGTIHHFVDRVSLYTQQNGVDSNSVTEHLFYLCAGCLWELTGDERAGREQS